MSKLRIVFAGTPEFALPCLDALGQSGHELIAVYTQPDRPAGRGRKLQPSPVKSWALERNLPVYQPLNFKEPDAVDDLAQLAPDVMVVIAYGLILPRKVLAIPRLGCINVHASLLPYWRGASPIQHAVLHGDSESGITIMQMDAGMDTGDSLLEVRCPLAGDETAGTLHDKLAALAAEPLLAVLEQLADGKAEPKPQAHDLATYAGKISKDDALIDWTKTAIEIERRIRAFNPWPIAFTHAQDEVIRIHQAQAETKTCDAKPGTIVAIDKSGIQVATGDGLLRIQRLQFAGGKIITVADWLNSGKAQLAVNLVLQ
ncbi:methionyl-tRNA formyltransferase [Legionella dresdenensis]|uniref:Methionyl-tRNA formyltransferase n=1 Tax=Legionella dresdenensis TaxID=450200 RepID=A0ABV8CG47_9GAMM